MTIVETRSGKVEGVIQDGIAAYKGIPFAAPPLGELRWQPPQPVTPWAGIRPAKEFSLIASQNASMMDALFGTPPLPSGEDCLYLNVWTPGADSKKRPVLVWIHGGGFVIGSSSQPIYDGCHLARRGEVVVVSINYRLGAFGFLNLKEVTNGKIPATGNEGLMDQIAGLAWVRDNIATFGGDPQNVTIFGESAGGMSIGALLSLPQAKGLFHKAIPQSGAGHTANTKAQAVRVAEAVLVACELKDPDALRQADAKLLLRAQARLAANKVPGHTIVEISGRPFCPTIDDSYMTNLPIDAIRKGAAKGVALMTGTTTEEWKLFGAMEKAIAGLNEESMLKRLHLTLPDTDHLSLLAPYREALPQQGEAPSPTNLFMAVQTDRVFTTPSIRMMEAHMANGGTAHAYLFDWKSPLMDGVFGACHALELGFMFGTYNMQGAERFSGSGPTADALSAAMMDAWISFARSGNPGWAAYDTDRRATMRFGADSALVTDPNSVIRQTWAKMADHHVGW